MNLETYSHINNLGYEKLKMPFGTYFLFDNFFVSEILEGVHFDWNKAEIMIEKLIDFYGKDAQLGFISNRVNHYSVDPSNWTKIEHKYNLIVASAIVIYNNSNFMNASIEKQFSQKSIKRCMSLTEAIDWMAGLKEFN